MYNDEPQISKAVYVCHLPAPFVEAIATTVEAADTAASLAVSANVAWSVTCDATWVTSFTQGGENNGTIEVVMEANESEEARVAVFTLSSEGLEAVEVKLTQKGKPAAGTVVGGQDDFDTKSANTSYTTGTTTAGWKYTNCALLNKGTVSAITDDSIGVTMNGKTTAVGSIESPVITTGCGTLKFNYAHGYKESNGFDFNVQIIQNGEIVNTFNVKNTSTTQNKMYQFEENINLSGEFSIKFTNNSPSKNSSSNKDRYTIWDVEWTGYTE